MKPLTVSLLTVALAACSGFAQTTIDTTNKFSWGENIGWMNWRDAGATAGAQGVNVRARFLSGYIWCENIGWVSLGDGTPANGSAYANTTGLDFGVNRDILTGNLSGYAWSENCGWINFAGGSLATPARPARYHAVDQRFYGMVWGENIGWISLDDTATGKYPAASLSCGPADVGAQGGLIGSDGILDNNDFVAFIDLFFNNDSRADVGQQGGITGGDGLFDNNDFVVYINLFFSGCD